MKKNLLSIVSLLFMVTISGCGNDSSSTTSNNENINTNSTITNTTNEESSSQNLVEYKIQVLLDDGSKAPSGVDVQLCATADSGGACVNVNTDAEGIATFNLIERDYDVHVNYDGYALEPGVIVYATERSISVTLDKIGVPASGDGSEANPYMISEGVYRTSIPNAGDVVYYSMSFTKVGTYSIESWHATPAVIVDPSVGYCDERLNATINDEQKGVNSQYGNYKVTFTITEENVNYSYIFGASGVNFRTGPKEYTFALKYISE